MHFPPRTARDNQHSRKSRNSSHLVFISSPLSHQCNIEPAARFLSIDGRRSSRHLLRLEKDLAEPRSMVHKLWRSRPARSRGPLDCHLSMWLQRLREAPWALTIPINRDVTRLRPGEGAYALPGDLRRVIPIAVRHRTWV